MTQCELMIDLRTKATAMKAALEAASASHNCDTNPTAGVCPEILSALQTTNNLIDVCNSWIAANCTEEDPG